ncbi:MAG: 30S ribosomal protein S16 [Candidatus Marinimicrobia bacterium]|nr:30S ribosomal protein S16 [Candidatus Neomarinimicrobiota bacterium]
MSTKIRLKRIGRRNRPFYRVIVIDSRKRRDGAAIEELGWYNPIEADNSYKLNEERIYYWLERGAQVSDTVHSLLQKAGIAFKWHLMRQGLDEKAVEKELQKWRLKQAEKAKQETKEKKEKAEPKKAETEEVETKEAEPKKVETEEAAQVITTLDAEPKKIEEQVIETEKTSEEPPKAVEVASAEETPAADDIQNSATDEKAEEKQQAGEG